MVNRDNDLSVPTYAALLIDMQPQFLRNVLKDTRKMLLSAQRQILQFCAQERIPTIVLEYVGEGKTVYCLQQKVELVQTHFTINKYDNDGFLTISLDEDLRSLNATDLIVMGINASYCVKETCDSAIKKSYRLHTARDCIGNCHCCAVSFDWYVQNSTLYWNSSQLIECVRKSLAPCDLESRVDQ